jgi:hypothetical protein
MFQSAALAINDGTYAQLIATQFCVNFIAADFVGFTQADELNVAAALTDLNLGRTAVEKQPQSIIDFISLENAIRGPMASSPEFSYNGQPLIDPSRVYYLGISYGGVMGNVFNAYDPNITRAGLVVPGGVWSLLLERSFVFPVLQTELVSSYRDPEQYELLIDFIGMAFEPYDPVTAAAHIIQDPLPGTPAKNLLMFYSMDDSVMPNLATEMMAREIGLTELDPTVKPVWNVPQANGPMANGLNVFNDHPTPAPPTDNVPPTQNNGTHQTIGGKAAAFRMLKAFYFGSQMAEQTCFASDGITPAACDCATGACD